MKTTRRIHELKMTQFQLIFLEKLRNKIMIEKSIAKREKMISLHKIKLIYPFKLNLML